jgi:hypothetical protein
MVKLWQRRVLGILAVGGGAIGVAATLTTLLQRSNPIEWFFCAGFAALYGWGIWCGVKLLEGMPGAERSNAKFWLIQVPTFSSPVLGYFMSSGLHFTVYWQPSPFGLRANFLLGSLFNYSLMQRDSPISVGVNLFALAVAWWLMRCFPSNNSFDADAQARRST